MASEKTGPFRKHRRHVVALRVRYDGTSGHVEEVVGNISLGGLKIAGPIGETVGDRVRLTIELPHLTEPVRVEGEVVWVERDAGAATATVGVRFLDLDPDLTVMLGHIFRSGVP